MLRCASPWPKRDRPRENYPGGKSKSTRRIRQLDRGEKTDDRHLALLVGDDEAPEEKLVAMEETKEASSPPLGRGFAFAARRRRQAFARP